MLHFYFFYFLFVVGNDPLDDQCHAGTSAVLAVSCQVYDSVVHIRTILLSTYMFVTLNFSISRTIMCTLEHQYNRLTFLVLHSQDLLIQPLQITVLAMQMGLAPALIMVCNIYACIHTYKHTYTHNA